VFHELARLEIHVVGVDQDLADVGLEVVANRADDETAFLVDQKGAALGARRAFDRLPQLQQIVQVPLQFLRTAADRGGAGDHAHADHAHAGGHFELIHDLAQFGAIVTLHAPGYAAATRVVGHQDEITPGEGNIGGERGALVAALVLFDLDDEFLADLQTILRACLAFAVSGREIAARDFLEGQKTMALRPVIDERRFKTGFETGDDGLVDVALAFFLGSRFDVEVDQFLTIDDRDAEFLGLRRIETCVALKSMRFIYFVLPRACTRAGRTARTIALYEFRSDCLKLLSSGLGYGL